MGLLLGLQNTLHPFMENPAWQRIAELKAAEQARLMRSQGLRAEILAAQSRTKNQAAAGRHPHTQIRAHV